MQDCKELDILSVTTTEGSLADAQALAREIIAQRLAACVQVEQGLTSFYRWKGEQCEEPEVRLVIKTMPGCERALQDFMARRHPYEVPQFLAAMAALSVIGLLLVRSMGPWVLPLSGGIFVAAWIAQFGGPKIEGKKPSFFEDLQYLWVGPLFVLSKLFERLGVRW